MFCVESTCKSVFTGGKTALSPDSKHLLSTTNDSIHVISLSSPNQQLENKSVVHDSFATQHGELHQICALSEDRVATSSRSLFLAFYNYSTHTLLKAIKAHEAPILTLAKDCTDSLVATGSADSTVRVWDTNHYHCTHVFKGHSGIVSIVAFHPTQQLLFSGGDDGVVRVWSLLLNKCVSVLQSHMSVVRALAFSNDHNYLLSASRDKVVNTWDLSSYSLVSTCPIYETIEGLGVMANTPQTLSDIIVYTVGDLGKVRIWNLKTSTCIGELDQISKEHGIIDSIQVGDVSCVVSGDHNIYIYNQSIENDGVPVLNLTKTICGYNDEILDLAYLYGDDDHVVMATNSELIKCYKLSTLDCKLLRGHSDIVLSLSVSKQYFASGSKDNSIILWYNKNRGNPESDKNDVGLDYQQVAHCLGHTAAVTSVALSPLSKFVVSASEDHTIKLWPITKLSDDNASTKLDSKYTVKAHDKDINAIVVAPNEKIFATASQDKTVKIWSSEDGVLLGSLKGHKRGVWSIAFSPIEKVIATASGDKTIKIWSLSDYSCLKTFEGHLNSVLKVSFINQGTQLVSTGSDGLLKVWNIKTNECLSTYDEHEEKVWGLSVSSDNQHIVTGGTDSKMIIWKDITQQELEETQKVNDEKILQEQELSTFIIRKDWKSAIFLALDMDKPFQLLRLFKKVIEGGHLTLVEDTLLSFSQEQIVRLLGYVKDWNTTAKFASVSQCILNIILRQRSVDDILEVKNAKDILEALLPYTERHFERAKKLVVYSQLLDYVIELIEE